MRAVEKGQLSAAKDLVLIFGAEVNSKDSFGTSGSGSGGFRRVRRTRETGVNE